MQDLRRPFPAVRRARTRFGSEPSVTVSRQVLEAGVMAGGLMLLLLSSSFPRQVHAEALADCEIGRSVLDDGNNPAVIVGGRDGLCIIKYANGQAQKWTSRERLHLSGSSITTPAVPSVTVVRPEKTNQHVYQADALGHIVMTVQVNGTPVRFLVDTGATLVALTPEDAANIGLKRTELVFNQTVHTANGPVRAAIAQLRDMRVDDLELEHVPAAVIDSLKQSVLGMSFLRRLKRFDMHDGTLTLMW